MRKILLAAAIVLVPITALAQKKAAVSYTVTSKLEGQWVIVIAQETELLDQNKVVGTISRGRHLKVEKSESDHYQVRWKGQSVWLSRADVLPFDRAINYFDETIRQHPTAVDYVARGRLRADHGDWVGALDDCNQAIRLDPELAWAYDNRGVVCLVKRERDKAMADFDTAIRLDPTYALAYIHRASMWQQNGDIKRALSDLNTAIRLDPTDSAAYSNRGTVWQAQGELDKALVDYTESIKLDPKFAMAYFNRGNVLKNQRSFDLAIANFDEAIRLDPKSATTYVERGWIRTMIGEVDKAMADFDEAIRLDPGFAMAFNQRGRLWCEAKGDFGRAMADFDEAIRRDPKNATHFNNRGLAELLNGDLGKAIVDFNNAIQLDPTYSKPFYNRARIQHIRLRADEAIADLDNAIRLEPKDASSYCYRAWIRATCGDERFRDGRIAVADATTACELTVWKECRSLGALAAAYAELGEFDKAVEMQRKAIDLAPNAEKKLLQHRLELFQVGKPYREGPVRK